MAAGSRRSPGPPGLIPGLLDRLQHRRDGVLVGRQVWTRSRLRRRPSSPRLAALSTFFSAWKTSAPQRSPSANDGAPIGMTMNSCMSTLDPEACLPPLRMFIIGTGGCARSALPDSGRAADRRGGRGSGDRQRPRIAFAPSRPLFSLPSDRASSDRPHLIEGVQPDDGLGEVSLTFRTAIRTPLPPYREGSSSRSSTASWARLTLPRHGGADVSPPSCDLDFNVGFPRDRESPASHRVNRRVHHYVPLIRLTFPADPCTRCSIGPRPSAAQRRATPLLYSPTIERGR